MWVVGHCHVPGGFAQPAADKAKGGMHLLEGNSKLFWFCALGSAAAILLGSVGTWGSVSAYGAKVSVSGLEGDGVYTLLLSLAAAGVLAAAVFLETSRKVRSILSYVAAGAGALTALIAILNLANISGAGSEYGVDAGWGLFLVLFGGIALTVLSILLGLQLAKAPAHAPHQFGGPGNHGQFGGPGHPNGGYGHPGHQAGPPPGGPQQF